MSSQKFHELVVQALFSLEMEGDDVLPLLVRLLEISKRRAKEGVDVARGVLERRDTYDRQIGEASENYELSRIPLVEKNILRYALFQVEEGNSPADVTKEAVRLARKFSTPEAGTFVNAVLNQLFPRDEQASR